YIFVSHKIYTDHFYYLNRLGRGGFGEVHRVTHKSNNKVYAIKMVNYPDTDSDDNKQRVLREVKSLSDLRSEYVVQYYHSWIENKFLYIQMEYCPQSLRQVLADKRLAFGRQSAAEPMNAIEYYISCEIFKELLECVDYLHQRSPQIIHRDLKPENILIASPLSGSNNSRRFIKLGDFGLATVHDPYVNLQTDHKHTPCVGTPWYRAPEVATNKYNNKADVYSLSRIGAEIFDLDLFVR
ncbi:unnamed protein product, partial [Medioppia subpectinata]